MGSKKLTGWDLGQTFSGGKRKRFLLEADSCPVGAGGGFENLLLLSNQFVIGIFSLKIRFLGI
jgi:hypothetical protein